MLRRDSSAVLIVLSEDERAELVRRAGGRGGGGLTGAGLVGAWRLSLARERRQVRSRRDAGRSPARDRDSVYGLAERPAGEGAGGHGRQSRLGECFLASGGLCYG